AAVLVAGLVACQDGEDQKRSSQNRVNQGESGSKDDTKTDSEGQESTPNGDDDAAKEKESNDEDKEDKEDEDDDDSESVLQPYILISGKKISSVALPGKGQKKELDLSVKSKKSGQK